jgi:hypothetical protein
LRRGAAAVLVLAALGAPAVARADADPASDFLIAKSVFLPYNQKVDTSAADRLDAQVRLAGARGFTIKVAVIAQPYDLGGVFQLYRKPQRYAAFLGQELLFVYKGRLLVAMPDGFGYSRRGRPDARVARSLAGLAAPGRDATKLVEAATTAVRRVAAASGVTLPVAEAGRGSSETRDRVVIAAAAAIGLVVVGAVVLFRRLLVQRRART